MLSTVEVGEVVRLLQIEGGMRLNNSTKDLYVKIMMSTSKMPPGCWESCQVGTGILVLSSYPLWQPSKINSWAYLST